MCNYVFKCVVFICLCVNKVGKCLVKCGYYVGVYGVYVGFFSCYYVGLMKNIERVYVGGLIMGLYLVGGV